MDQPVGVYAYNRILFSYKNKWYTDTYYNVDETPIMLSERSQALKVT